MLIGKRNLYESGVVIIMSDIAILAATVKTTLLDIAKQAQALGTGLQVAAPGDKSGAPNNSVQYLLTISENLVASAKECEALLAPSSSDSTRS